MTGRPRLTDGLVVSFNLVLGVAGLAGNFFRGSFAPGEIVFVVVEALPLWWRRRHPEPVLAVIVCAELARWAFGFSNEPLGPALVFAVYAVSVYGRPTARLVVAALSIALIVVAVSLLLIGALPVSRNLIPAGALSLVAWVIGDYLRSRRQFFADLVARHQAAREQAAEEERLRIARELHDVVAHNVSVIAIQAGAARVSGVQSPEAMQVIEATARATLAELSRLLGVLRKADHSPALIPQPGLDQVDLLLKAARDTGVDVTLKVAGQKRPLAPTVDLSAYRIVQEAITNVLKHANASRAEVILDYRPDSLDLTISDNGSGATPAGPPTGHGLIGMRERVEMFGGSLGTGSSPLGGFTVHATLPTR